MKTRLHQVSTFRNQMLGIVKNIKLFIYKFTNHGWRIGRKNVIPRERELPHYKLFRMQFGDFQDCHPTGALNKEGTSLHSIRKEQRNIIDSLEK